MDLQKNFEREFAGLNHLGNVIGDMRENYNMWMKTHKEFDLAARNKNKIISRLNVAYETIDRGIMDSIDLRRANREILRLVKDNRGNEAVVLMEAIESRTKEIETKYKLDFSYHVKATEASKVA